MTTGNSLTSKQSLIALALLLAAVGVIFGWNLNLPYFSDDWQQVYANPRHSATAYFFTRPPSAERYIPLQTMVLSLSQWISGPNTWLIRVFNMIAHAVVAWLSWHLALRFGLSRHAAAIAAGFVVSSQLGATAVLQNDSPSQILSAVAGLVAILASFEYCRTSDRLYLIGIFGAVIFGFLTKETFVGWFIPVVGISFLRYDGAHWRMRPLRSSLTVAIPLAVLLTAYMVFHANIGLPNGQFGGDRYNVHLGLNILRNAGQLLFAVLLPLSTVWVYTAIAHKALAMELAAVVSALVVLGIALRGLPRLRSVWIVMLLATIGSVSPVIVLNHVSELYAHGLLPIAAIAIAAGCETLLRSKRGAKFIMVVIVMEIGLNFWSIRSKTEMMLAEGNLHAKLLPQLQRIAASLPYKSHLYLLNPVRTGDEYSVFLARGFNVFSAGEQAVGDHIGRTDIQAQIVEQSALDSVMRVSPGVTVTYDTTSFVVRLGQPVNHPL